MYLEFPGKGKWLFVAVLYVPVRSLISLIQVDAAIHHTEQIGYLVNQLESCEYDHSVFKQILDDIQNLVGNLNLRSYTNLSRWVAELNQVVCTCIIFVFLIIINYKL